MSTATKSSPSESRRYVDYDEFIDFQVQKTRTGIKSNDLLTAFVGGAAAVLAYVLVFAIFDHWVIAGGFGRGVRIALLSALAVGLGVWFVWKLAIPYFRRVTALYAAREIELTEPAFRSTLLTLVDLKQAGRQVSPEIRAVLEKRAGLGLTHMNVEHAVDRRLLMRLSYALLALVVVTCLYALLSPKKLSNSLWRSLLPTAAVAVDTRTRIAQVDPGDADVLARSQLPVTVELSGILPDEVTLFYSTADRRLVDEPIAMRETDGGIRQYRGIITGENGRGILQNLKYHIVAGDARSDAYTVTVSQPPSAAVDEVEYEFPQYMGFRNRVQIGGAIDGWEGTWVTIRATANMPVKSALVMFSDSDDLTQKAEELPVEIENGTLLTARWQLRIRSDGTYPNFYRLQCRNEAGQTDPSPALHPIKILADQPPQIQLAQPTSDLERPANAVVPLLFATQDPDFLLRSVTLRFEHNGEGLPQSPRLYEGPPYRKSVTGTHNLELGPLNLQPGDKLTYWLEARDNMEPFADRSGNRSNTPKLNITITEPASPEEVQQQLEEDRREVEERLEEAQQEPGGEGADPTPAGDDDSADTPPPPNEDPEARDPQPADHAVGDQAEQGGEQQGEPQSQPGEPSTGKSDSQQRQIDSQNGEGTESEQGTQPGESANRGEPGNQEAPFDDLLKELMQRERQQAGQEGDSAESGESQPNEGPQQRDPSDSGEPPPSADPSQPAGAENPTGEPRQTGAESDPASAGDAASPSSDNSDGEGTGTSSTSPNGKTEPTPGDVTEPSRPGDRPSPSPQSSEGTEPSEGGDNPNVREGDADGGRRSQDDVPPTPQGQPPSDLKDTDAARREPADGSEQGDPKTSRSDGPPNSENRRPAPAGTQAQPTPDTDATPAEGAAGEQPPGPLSQPGQPGGPQESPSAPGDPSGNQSGQTQAGENAGSSPTSAGQAGGQKQSGDPSASQPGQKSQSGRPDGSTDKGEQQPSFANDESAEKDGQAGREPSSSPDGDEPDGAKPEGGEPTSAGGDDAPPAGEKGGEKRPQEDSPPSEQTGGERAEGEPKGGQADPGGEQQSGGESQGGSESGQKQEGQQQGGQKQGDQQQAGRQQGGDQGGGQQESTQQGGQQQGGQQGPGTPQGGAHSRKGGGSAATGDQGPQQSPPQGPGDGGDRAAPGAGEGEGEAADNIGGEAPDLDAQKKAANLVLKRLQEQLQRGEIDPALKQELGVTDAHLRDFTKRLQERLADTGEDVSPEAEARRRQFDETLRTIDYDSTGTERAGGEGPREATGGFAGPQRTAPLSRREATREYRQWFSGRRPAGSR